MDITTAPRLNVDRKRLVKALERLARIVPVHSTKPILQCVRLESSAGTLGLAVTDLDTSLTLQVPCEGDMVQTVVTCRDLLQRVKTGKGAQCQLSVDAEGLIVNGGAVHHRLGTLDPREFPLVPQNLGGKMIRVNCGQIREAIKTALTGVARDPTRYAINGVLLEVAKQVHVAATDGRRLVTSLIKNFETDAEFSTILPVRFCQTLIRLIESDDDAIDVYVKENINEKGEKQPSDVSAVGPGWVLHSLDLAGHFPAWREIVPKDGSRFLLDRTELLSLIREVSTAAGELNKGVRLRLSAEGLSASCRSGTGSESTGQAFCRFLGGGDNLILTGFNPAFLEDMLTTLTAPRVVMQVQQNRPAARDEVAHYPAVFSNWPDSGVRWVIMPVRTDVKASLESLGSNYRESVAA